MSIPTPAKRACDGCHRRKIRCNSRQPCGNCSQAGLACTYDAPPQKKGPKGSRAKVISEIRETQKQSDFAQHGQWASQSPPRSPSYAPTPGLLTPELIHACSQFFFAHMYHTTPILDRDQVGDVVSKMGYCGESYCLIAALCAFMLIQPGISSQSKTPLASGTGASMHVTNAGMGNALMEEAIRVRKAVDYVETPTTNTVRTSFLLFGCCFGLNKHNAGWLHLREATALAQVLGMQHESAYVGSNATETLESIRNRRLFWLLFVTERAYALQKHRPLTLHATIGLPTLDYDAPHSIKGFRYLVDLYRPFDEVFVGLWNKTRRDCTTPFLAHLQRELTNALPECLDITETQAADLRISQQWLRTLVWQLSLKFGFLSSASSDSSMTFMYPIEIARDLIGVITSLSKHSMEVHGIGLIEKVFDIACTLIDVMVTDLMPGASYQLSGAPLQQYLNTLLILISSLRGGNTRFLPLIMAKIQDEIPGMVGHLPPDLSGRTTALHVHGSTYGPLGGINGPSPWTGWHGAGAPVFGDLSVLSRADTYIKQESTSSSGSASASVSDSGSPYSVPPLMHYYPLS